MVFEFSLMAAVRKAVGISGVPLTGAGLGAVPLDLANRFEKAMSIAPVASLTGDLSMQGNTSEHRGIGPTPQGAQADGFNRPAEIFPLNAGVAPRTDSDILLPTRTLPQSPAVPSAVRIGADEPTAREAEFDNGGNGGISANGLNVSSQGTENLKTLGDRILNTLQGTASRWDRVMHPTDAAGRSADLQLGPVGVLQLQKELVTVSVEVELMTKGVGIATKNVDQLVRIS